MKLSVGSRVYTPNRIFCVGMNYVEHIRELKNEIPSSPVIFMKPPTCLVATGGTVTFPPHGNELHYETELVVLIGTKGKPRTHQEAQQAIGGLSLGLDMTLRDTQQKLRSKGKPWELCKAFENSAPVGEFSPPPVSVDLNNLEFTGTVNGKLRQHGNTSDLVFPITTLIQYLAGIWTLLPGDLLYTGTPQGVGAVQRGDRLTVEAPWCGRFEWTIT
jgi:2-keto-4-pentenoate hydratase/2-oxohepta-3-ene-1,7-dioic acid hydratase in catechol pathway